MSVTGAERASPSAAAAAMERSAARSRNALSISRMVTMAAMRMVYGQPADTRQYSDSAPPSQANRECDALRRASQYHGSHAKLASAGYHVAAPHQRFHPLK